MIIDPKKYDYPSIYKLIIGSIVPRPIAFVSSLGRDGTRNLAPFSFFNGICSNPPSLLFCTTVRKDGQEKDTLRNVAESGEFVVNIVSEEFAEQMNICSTDFPPDVDEFRVSGLTPVGSDLVAPPRVGESHISMECRLNQIVRVGEGPGSGRVVIGEILRFHIRDDHFDSFRIDQEKLRAIGRMGGPTYTRTRDRFDLVRPQAGELKDGEKPRRD